MCRTLLSSSRRASWPTTQTAHERALPLEEGLVRLTELMSRIHDQFRSKVLDDVFRVYHGPATGDDGGEMVPDASRTPHTHFDCVLTTKTLQRNTPVDVVPRRLNVSDSVRRELLRCLVVVVFSCLLLSWRRRERLLAELIKLLERVVETTLVIVIPVPASLADAWDLCEPKPMPLVEGLRFPRDS